MQKRAAPTKGRRVKLTGTGEVPGLVLGGASALSRDFEGRQR